MANDQDKAGQQGGTAQNNPGSFANDAQRASEASQKGDQMSGGRPENQQTGHGSGSNLQEDDPQRAGGATQRGGQGGLKAVSKSELLFPGRSIGRPLSNMAMLQKIRGMDEKSLANNGPGWRNEAGEVITMHGFRSSFRNWAAETTNFANIVPEMALAHKISNATEAAYRRGDLLEKRKQLMEEWARYALSGCKAT